MFWKKFLPVTMACVITLFTVTAEKPKSRPKRGWIMPGTLWCGVGSTAENFTNLGVFDGVDRCCREHDHCSPQIQAFEFLYGIRNYRFHTISHCDCDQRFRLCLHALNDAVSTIVGSVFFNILEMPCFSLKEEEQCVEWYWWGGCKTNGIVPKAEIHKPAIFNSSNPEGSHISAPILHKGGQRGDSEPHSHNLTTLPPVLAKDAKSRRRRLKKLQRAQTRRQGQGRIKERHKAEERSGKIFSKQ